MNDLDFELKEVSKLAVDNTISTEMVEDYSKSFIQSIPTGIHFYKLLDYDERTGDCRLELVKEINSVSDFNGVICNLKSDDNRWSYTEFESNNDILTSEDVDTLLTALIGYDEDTDNIYISTLKEELNE